MRLTLGLLCTRQLKVQSLGSPQCGDESLTEALKSCGAGAASALSSQSLANMCSDLVTPYGNGVPSFDLQTAVSGQVAIRLVVLRQDAKQSQRQQGAPMARHNPGEQKSVRGRHQNLQFNTTHNNGRGSWAVCFRSSALFGNVRACAVVARLVPQHPFV